MTFFEVFSKGVSPETAVEKLPSPVPCYLYTPTCMSTVTINPPILFDGFYGSRVRYYRGKLHSGSLTFTYNYTDMPV